MELQHKPRLGILALMLEGYEPLFPGIMASQHKYVEEVIASLSGTADFVFPRIAASREAIEALTAQYNAEGLDGILILMLSYSQGQYLVHAMQRNTLPLALALVQPDETVGDDFEEWELTVNQGIHGSQDNANCLMRAGIPCAFFAGSRKNGELAAFAADFGAAAHTACALRRMKIGIIGKLAGMGDVITDDMAVYRKLGPEFVYDSIGAVQRACAGGYAAEGDATAAMLMAAMLRLCGQAGFSEMYMMDFAREAILLCHAGEGNWAMCRRDKKPFLMDRVFNEGGLSNPPTPIFTPEPGPAGVMSLVHVGGERFRLVYAPGEILDECSLRKIDMPYMFFRPASGVRACIKAWLEQGGTHHEIIVPGDYAARVRLLCRLLGIEFVEV